MRSTDPDWLTYKMDCLTTFFPNKNLTPENNTYRCHSMSDPNITKFYNQLYKEGKRRVSDDNLHPLMDAGIAIWFLDNGGKTGRNAKNAYLNTTNIGEEGTEIARTYFRSIECESKPSRCNNRIRLLFTVAGTEQLFKIIAPTFPNFMHYRL